MNFESLLSFSWDGFVLNKLNIRKATSSVFLMRFQAQNSKLREDGQLILDALIHSSKVKFQPEIPKPPPEPANNYHHHI